MVQLIETTPANKYNYKDAHTLLVIRHLTEENIYWIYKNAILHYVSNC